MLRSLTYMGFRRFPLTYTGVPGIEKDGRPVGFEKEISQLIDVVERLLNSRINENLLVVIVGEYGWGKTELLDYFINIVSEKYDGKVEIARVPLTFNLSSQHIFNILRRRSEKPLILIIDEADEIVRILSLKKISGDGKDIERIITELSSTIRALLEPRQYAGVIGINPEKLKNMLIIVAVTPQVYYGILKSYVPDIFDISVGRIFREIVLKSEVSLWLYEAIVREKFKAASTNSRIREIERGRLDPLHPLKFEYLTSLYYILKIAENRTPSPRTLLKYTAKLLDNVIRSGELNLETYLKFLREISNEIPIVKNIIEKISEIETLYADDIPRKIRILLELCPIPLTESFIISQCRCSRDIINKLVEIGEISRVYLIRVKLRDRNILKILNKIRIERGLGVIEYVDDREVSIEIDDYYTRYEDEPTLYMIIEDQRYLQYLKDCKVEIQEAYIPKSRIILTEVEYSKPENSIVQLIRRLYIEYSKPEKILEKFTEAFYGKCRIFHKINDGVYVCYTNIEGINLRVCNIMFNIDILQNLDIVKRVIDNIIEDSYIKIGRDEILYDIIHVLLYSSTREIDEKVVDNLMKGDWKIPGIERSLFMNISILDISKIEQFRRALIGYELRKLLNSIPEKYRRYVKYYEDLKARIDSFVKNCENYILKNLTLGIRRVRYSKSEAIREIVDAWIRNDKILDQPDVWRDEDGKAKISTVEKLLYTYLKARYSNNKLNIREIERIIRRLFPTHLWRDFREKDLVELCKLRGLIIEIEDDRYVPYSPSIAKLVIARHVNRVKDLEGKFSRDVKLKLCGRELKVRTQFVNTETIVNTSRIKNLISEVASLKDDFESIRRFSKILLELSSLESKLIEEISRSENTLSKICKLCEDVSSEYEKLRDCINKISSIFPRLASRIEKYVNDELDSTLKLVETCENIEISELYEIIERMCEKISIIYSDVEKISEKILHIEKLLEKASYLKNANLTREFTKYVKDLDLKMLKLKDLDLEKVYRLVVELEERISAKLSSIIASLSRDVESIRRVCRILCKLGYEDVCKVVDNVDVNNVDNTKQSIKNILMKILGSEKYVNALLELAKFGDEFDVNTAKSIVDDVDNFLNILEKSGLVRRLYRFVF